MIFVRLPHSEVRLTYTTDWHTSGVPPGRRASDYQEAILNKIKFVSDITEKIQGASLCGADVFHIKDPRNHKANSVNLLVSLIHLLRCFPTGKVWGGIGNHDLSWDRMDSLPTQPLGLLIAAQVYHNLCAESVIFTNQDESVKVLVEAFPYEDEISTLNRIKEAGKTRPQDVDYRIGLVHSYGAPGDRGNIYSSPVIGYNELKDVEYDFLLWGHDHSRKETMTVGKVTHVHLGSLARAALNYDEVDRPVSIAIMAFSKEGIKFQEKPIPVKPLNLAFVTSDKGMDTVSKTDEMKEFFSTMETAVGGIETSDPREFLQSLCDDTKLLGLVHELCSL